MKNIVYFFINFYALPSENQALRYDLDGSEQSVSPPTN